MLANDKRRARMGQALMAMVKDDVFFTESGPTKAAWKAFEDRTMSTGELLLLDLAMALWRNGGTCPRVSDLWSRLDERCYQRVVDVLGLLLSAPEVIDQQLDCWGV